MTSKRFIVKNGLDNNSQTIINVSDPVNAQDAATKNFSSNANNITSGILAIAYGGTGVSAFTANGALYVTSSNTLTSGTLPILSGGTSANTATGAFNALAPSQTGNSGKYLTTDGTNTSWGTVSGSGGTSTASVITATSTNASFYPTFVSATTGNNALNVNSSLTYNPSTATLTTTNIVATTFSGSGASLTNLPAGTLTGTVPSAVLGNTTIYVGTTAVTLNRASSNLGLTGITSLAMPGATSGTITLTPAATAGTTAITIPATAGTLVTTGDTGTVTNAMLAGSIANAKLANSAVTIGNTAISLGSSNTTIAGLTSVTSTTFIGALTGNATTATTLATSRTLWGQGFTGATDVTGSLTSVGNITGTAGVTLTATAATLALAATGANSITASTNGTVKFTIDSTGNITPGTTNTQTLGDVGDVWSNVHATTFTGTLTGNADTATKWATARLLAGNSVDGSANVAFSNKFVVQGTTDTGLSGAQFLGALGTGIVKNTTTTGVLSIAVAGDFPTLNQNTTGSAATLTTARTINGTSFNGSADITVTAAAGTLTGTTLNATVVNSSLTSVGTLSSLAVTGTTTQTGAFNLAGAASPLQVQGSAGTSGQVLTSAGTGATPTWSTVAGTGTVTSVSVVTANGVSGTVATSTTTPAITVTLGAITPSSVTSSGIVTGTAFVPSGSSVPSNGMYLSAANTLNWSTATTLAMTLSSAGALTVVNDITAFSDSRLKANIETIPDALTKVEAVRGVTFTRTDSDDKQKRHTGVIAQEIEAVLPEAVHINADGIRSVAYGNMMGLLIEAVKELSSQNKALLARLEVLEAKE